MSDVVHERETDRSIGARVARASPGHAAGAADHCGRIVGVVETATGPVYVVAWDDGPTTFVPRGVAVTVDRR